MSVTLDELKSHLRIEWANEDAILQIYLDSAIAHIDSHTGRRLSQEARHSYFDSFDGLELIGDAPTGVVVTYIDVDGVEQTLASSVYSLKTHKARPYLTLAYGESWPSVRSEDAAVKVSYTSGYSVSTLPETLKAAVLMEAATQYEFRENESIARLQLRKAVERLAYPHVIFKL